MWIFKSLAQLFFPRPCLSCGVLGQLLCIRCVGQLNFQPETQIISGLSVASSLRYENNPIFKALIHSFKYKHEAEALNEFIGPLLQACQLLMVDSRGLSFIPVPLHSKRLKERGYNQAALLAKKLAHESGGQFLDLLKRVRHTSAQAHTHSKKERAENMHGAFECPQIKIPLSSQIVLVDDIVTTGSTLLACQAALQEKGYQNITALTLAQRPLQKQVEEKTLRDWD